MKFYAIGLKNWVEIREAKQPPRPKETIVDMLVEQEESYRSTSDGLPVIRKRKRKVPFQMKQTTYAGGKVIAMVSLNAYRRAGFSIADGVCSEIPSSVARLFKDRA